MADDYKPIERATGADQKIYEAMAANFLEIRHTPLDKLLNDFATASAFGGITERIKAGDALRSLFNDPKPCLKCAEQAPFVEVGKAMVEITTTVRGPEEWGAIPELWRQCMHERDKAYKELKIQDQAAEILSRDNADLLSQVRTASSFAKTAQQLKAEAEDKCVRQTFEIAALREERQKAEDLAVQYRQEADHLRVTVSPPKYSDQSEWYCASCNIVHPIQNPGMLQECPSCRAIMTPTSTSLRKIRTLKDEISRLKGELEFYKDQADLAGTTRVHMGKEIDALKDRLKMISKIKE